MLLGNVGNVIGSVSRNVLLHNLPAFIIQVQNCYYSHAGSFFGSIEFKLFEGEIQVKLFAIAEEITVEILNGKLHFLCSVSYYYDFNVK